VCGNAHRLPLRFWLPLYIGICLAGSNFADLPVVTAGELAIMRRHVDLGAEILSATDRLAADAPIVLPSHERYKRRRPRAKAHGLDYPLASRVIAVGNGYDAMTQDRSYRLGTHSSDAIVELLRCSLTQYDPDALRV